MQYKSNKISPLRHHTTIFDQTGLLPQQANGNILINRALPTKSARDWAISTIIAIFAPYFKQKRINIMKALRFLVLTAAMLAATAVSAQNIVKWSQSVKDNGNGHYTLAVKASIADGWHLYDLGPYKEGQETKITFTSDDPFSTAGVLRQTTEPKRVFEEAFNAEIGYFEKKAVFEQDIILSAESATITASIEYMVCDNGSCMPLDAELVYTIGNPASAPTATAEKASAQTVTAAPQADTATDNRTLWTLIIEAVLWGFAALLTPCVFPMVPMTVSFFMKGSANPARGRLNASLYGLFIVALYTLPIAAIIIITRVVGGDAVTADIFNFLATHWLPNILFFIVFMVFAASFFGAFEIVLPSSLINKSDAKSEKSGMGGIFFMALTLVLVSFSCTGPIVGSVLIKSTAGEFWNPILTMFAFSVAFALPFTLLAFFPSLLKKMPKSGGWLNSVKVVLGFVEVALGFKFLSVADQTYHWGLLDREVYLAIWIVVFALLGLYLLGKIRFAHDSELPYLGVGRLALAIGVFSFVVYLIPGMWGAPLKALSGYLPPLTTQDFVIGSGDCPQQQPAATKHESTAPKYSDFLHLPHGLQGFFDLQEAQEYADKSGKPLFIAFTGHGCVNCREMEARVWSAPEVLSILRNDYVIVALYTDDKKQLPREEWITTDTGKTLKSLGKINSHLALKRYGINAQPYYVLQGRNGRMLAEPRGYNLDVADFVKFLQKGLEEYGK